MLLPTGLSTAHTHHVAGFFKKPEKRAMGSGRELWARRKDGSTLPVEVTLNPVRTEAACS